MAQAQSLPRALVYIRKVPGNQGRLHQVLWYRAGERPDLSGDDVVRGCCDCMGYFMEATVRGRRDYVCPHMLLHYSAALAESKKPEGTDK